ncbi:UDP-Glycosyltransferase/glycogen phosphorylase [Tilletiopsis washingtonensis]|uniref:Alpha-1,3/1,6-mannosyltransferase ALG2 n=1 Tax=Tilletiopsis washingtonensis TaxID=58919 RepID=A0A316ZFK8_9BASI|nr:UDP-Glycosyltransferase/glycogen phosphorylase [Tilletiopsis washingtonensis]PWN99135.1 UDP-Glycosyltransferase/glycogen phosphorylase [Tilletiopsis washingtonensis]
MPAATHAAAQTPERKLRIAFIHPDLGIGGAEKLVVDAALGLQARGHDVEILTSHHDLAHCFEATRDGTLVVRHVRTRLPRSLFHAFTLPMAIAQQFSLFAQLLVALFAFRFPGTLPGPLLRLLTSLPPSEPYDVVFVDQLSAIVPWVRTLTATRVVFFCHYPDKEIGGSIARQRALDRGYGGPGLLRALYRIPFDFFEEATIDSSDKILVNSEFTQRQFGKSFPRLRREPRVLYPGIDAEHYDAQGVKQAVDALGELGSASSVRHCIRDLCMGTDVPTLVSINRFEAKKNVALALEAFAQRVKEQNKSGKKQPLRLVVVGGYDRRVRDNIETLDELEKRATQLGLVHTTLFWTAQPHQPPASAPPQDQLEALQVIFLPSLPGALIPALLLSPNTRALLYTPKDEHFGIVPLEAMACGVPVLSANSGGPVETVVDAGTPTPTGGFTNPDGTGLLRQPRAAIWAGAIGSLLDMSDSQRAKMAKASRERVRARFSTEVMTDGLEAALRDTLALGRLRNEENLFLWGSTFAIFALMAAFFFHTTWK